jgi:O-acetyl-ADP-ribose deacetylase (regulator of RNase III)
MSKGCYFSNGEFSKTVTGITDLPDLKKCPKCGDSSLLVGCDGNDFNSGAPYRVGCLNLKCDYQSIIDDNLNNCIEDWNLNNRIIEVVRGNLLYAPQQVIAHQTNCNGIMGGGVAKQIRKKYPAMYVTYVARCITKRCLGTTQLVEVSDGYIANVFGQNSAGTDYDSLESAFNELIRQMHELELTTLAMPYKTGCGLGGGDWNTVYGIIENCFDNVGIKVSLYKMDS